MFVVSNSSVFILSSSLYIPMSKELSVNGSNMLSQCYRFFSCEPEPQFCRFFSCIYYIWSFSEANCFYHGTNTQNNHGSLTNPAWALWGYLRTARSTFSRERLGSGIAWCSLANKIGTFLASFLRLESKLWARWVQIAWIGYYKENPETRETPPIARIEWPAIVIFRYLEEIIV